MASQKPEYREWPEVYCHIRDTLCGRCEFKCTETRRIFCIEQFLYITSHWEIENNYLKKT